MKQFPKSCLALICSFLVLVSSHLQAADQVVTNNANSGVGSLRQAIADVTSGGTITFNLSTGNESITITSELEITKAMTIDGANIAGSGVDVTVQVTTPGTSAWRVFLINASGSTINLLNMALKGGDMGSYYGGAIQIIGGTTVNLTGMNISGCKAYDGGGIYIAGTWSIPTNVTVTSSTFYGNSASHRGGGIFVAYYTNLTINSCEFTGNSGNGGAVMNGGVVTIIKSTFSGNSGWVGGTIFNFNSAVATVVSCTISGNSSGWYTGGIYSEGTCYLLNSILINNTGTAGRDISVGSGATYAYFCWYNSTYGTINTQASAPNVTTAYSSGDLGALANNGGPTQTMAVTATSPALNNGAFAYYNATDNYYFLDNQATPVSHKLTDWATSPVVVPTDKITTDQRGLTISALPSIGAYNPVPVVLVTATAGTTSAGYGTLREAFNAINAGTHQGAITVMINSSTTETAAAVLYASSSPSSYVSVNIYPTLTGLSLSGNLNSPLIDLNGATNVTIDGRVNATGAIKDLVITNTSTSSDAGTSTIRFINDACSNIVKYCVIKGSELVPEPWSGILFFSTAGSNNGNDNNVIDHNDITCASDINRPQNAVYSFGTAGKENDGNTVSNNNIFDFFSRSVTTCGIYLDNNNSAWTISDCSFYEQNAFTSSSSQSFSAVRIYSPTGNNFNITGNYIGGSAAICSGTLTKNNSGNNAFYGIIVTTGPGTTSNIQGNTIRNFNYANSSSASWYGISVRGGDFNIGTVTSNTIGVATGNSSVIFTNTTSDGSFSGIDIAGTGTTNTHNNIIGSITTANTNAANATNFFGITTSSTGTITIVNNTIGSETTASSINLSSPSTTKNQMAIGILNEGPGNLTISGNLIAKMTNGITGSDPNNRGFIHGILSIDGSNTISDNIIRNFTIANANTTADYMAPAIGIALIYTTDAAQSITGNTIYNISNTFASFAGNVIGLYYNGSTTSSMVSGNFIHSLSVTGASSTAASIYGIKIMAGTTTYANNIISLGGNTQTTIYGISETGTSANNNNLYYNTVYLDGTLASGSTNKSYALYSAVTTNTRNFRNNIFSNARSTTSGSNLHYAAWFNYAASTNLTLDYNNYLASGIGGVLGYYNSANVTSIPLISGQDASSKSVDPGFDAPGGTSPNNYRPSASSLVGVTGTGITTDYGGIVTRSTIYPSMGAWEYDVTPCNPSITSQSTGAQTRCIGGTFNPIAVTATGPDLVYQWYSKPDQITSGGTAVGINSNSYTPLATVAGTLYYYCVVTNACGTATSAISGAFVVNSLPAPTVYSAGSTTFCQGNSVTLNVSGNALQFGSNSSVEINDDPILRFTSAESYTVMAWVYVQSLPNAWTGIVTKSRDQGSYYGIWIDPANRWVYGTGTLPWDFNNIDGSNVTIGWHHIAIVQTGSVGRNLLVDGVSVGTGTVQNADGIGLLRFGRSGDNFEVFEGGILDEVSIFNTNVSLATINTWKNVSITSAHPDYANLVGYWKLDEGTGTTTADASGHGLTGTLVNSPIWVATSAPVNQFSSYLWSPGSATTSTLNVTASETYSVNVTDANSCSNTASGVTVTVDPVSVGGTIAGSATVCSGTNSTTLTLSGHTGSVVKWQYSTNNWANSTDVVNTTTTLVATDLTATTKYRAVIQSGVCSSANSAEATVTVDPVSVGGTIAGSATVCSGTNSTTLTLSGHTGSVVKWQYSTNNWANSTDVVNITTTLVATDLTATTKYRAVIQSGVCSSANSGDATVTVDPVSVGGTIAGSATVCSGTNSTTLTLSGHTGSIVKWQKSTDNWVNSTDVVNTTTTLVATDLIATTKYRAVIQSGVCSSANSAEATVTVDPVSVGGTIAGSATVCSGTNSTTLTLSGHTGSVVKWQYSTNNWVSSTDVANTTTTLVATNLTATTKYRAVIQSGVCSVANSAEATVSVNPIGQVDQPSSEVVCNNEATTTVTFTTVNTGGTTTYAWTNDTPSIGLAASGSGNIASFTAINTGTTPVVATIVVTPTFTNGGVSCSGPTKTFTITVNPLPVPTISGNDVLCENSGYYDYATEPGMNSYVWTTSAGGTITWGAGTNQIQVLWNTAGAQSVTVTYVDPNGCGASLPTVLPVTVNPMPGNAGAITGSSSVCGGAQGVAYSTVPIANAVTYVWSLPAGAVIATGDGTPAITVNFDNNASSGNISVYGNNQCGNGAVSPSFDLVVNPKPQTPVIIAMGDTLESSAPLGNQWYFSPTGTGGNIIPGATAQIHVAAESGWYWTVVSLNGCESEVSNKVYILITGEEELAVTQFVVYPVPNDGRFTVSILIPTPETFSISIFNKAGQKIYTEEDLLIDRKFEKTLDLRPLSNGVYTVLFENSQHRVIRKVLVNR